MYCEQHVYMCFISKWYTNCARVNSDWNIISKNFNNNLPREHCCTKRKGEWKIVFHIWSFFYVINVTRSECTLRCFCEKLGISRGVFLHTFRILVVFSHCYREVGITCTGSCGFDNIFQTFETYSTFMPVISHDELLFKRAQTLAELLFVPLRLILITIRRKYFSL